MLPQNHRVHRAAPNPKNQNSSVAQAACSIVVRENAPKNVWVTRKATGRRKTPITALSQRRGTTRGAATGGGRKARRWPLGRGDFFFWLTRAVCLTARAVPPQNQF